MDKDKAELIQLVVQAALKVDMPEGYRILEDIISVLMQPNNR